jgi:hypothetical protein
MFRSLKGKKMGGGNAPGMSAPLHMIGKSNLFRMSISYISFFFQKHFQRFVWIKNHSICRKALYCLLPEATDEGQQSKDEQHRLKIIQNFKNRILHLLHAKEKYFGTMYYILLSN